jgi:hypothetical protein
LGVSKVRQAIGECQLCGGTRGHLGAFMVGAGSTILAVR